MEKILSAIANALWGAPVLILLGAVGILFALAVMRAEKAPSPA